MATAQVDKPETYPWIKDKVLGTGGFGTVILWNNKETGDAVAIKTCRWDASGNGMQNFLSKKHFERWETEVKIMNKLDHIGVVKCFPLPAELSGLSDSRRVLCMEYCAGGDLRKVLNRPENCCGLKEKYIIGCLEDMSGALTYLHSIRIIHRDLKPENIVLQNVDGQIHYKLIDLGYAKELDQSSACMSLVGTLQYLAPELHLSKVYSCTVDYWSWGLVTHEIITGVRPFLPNLPPAECMKRIQNKKPEDICVHEDRQGAVQFRSTILPEVFISSPLKRRIEEWLKVMLEWDPKLRGYVKDSSGKSKLVVFSMINDILSMKIIKVFVVETCKFLEYEVSQNISMNDIQLWVERDSGIAPENQRLLLPRGQPPEQNLPATQCWAPPDEEEFVLYVFSETICRPRDPPHFPPLLEEMLRYSRNSVEYIVQRKMYAHCILFLQREANFLNLLTQAQKVSMLHLMTGHAQVTKLSQKLLAEVTKLKARHNLFMESLKTDLDFYDDYSHSGRLSSPKMSSSWGETGETTLKKVHSVVERVQKMDESWTILNRKILDLQCSPFSHSKKMDTLDTIIAESEELYTKLRRRTKEERAQVGDNIEMCKLVVKALRKRDSLHQDMYKHLQKQCECLNKVGSLSGPLLSLMQDLSKANQEISSFQKERQMDKWKIIDVAVKHVSPHFEETTARIQRGEGTVDPPPSINSKMLSSLLEKSILQTDRIISDNRDLRCRVINLLYTQVDAVTPNIKDTQSGLNPGCIDNTETSV